MSIKKSLLALAAAALATMAFASPAMAVNEDVLRDVTNNEIIPANRVLHFVGWAKFETGEASYECHVTALVKVTGETGKTGHVQEFTIPDTTKCTGLKAAKKCTVEAHEATTTNASNEHVWDVTSTENDFDVFNNDPNHDAGELVIHIKYKSAHLFEGCFLSGQEITLTFPEITLKPLNTENPRVVTNTQNKLGNTAQTGDPIAGVEISGTGILHGPLGEEEVHASGELELTEADRCTWKLAKE